MMFLSRHREFSLLRPIAVLLAVLLAAHAPMLLNDGLFMDDWLVLKARPDSVIDIEFLLTGAGHPIFYSYDKFANWTGAPIAVMVSMALAGIGFGATCLVLTARRLRLLDPAEAVGVALIVWTYPGYQLWAGKANAVYVLSFGLTCVGAWLLTLAFAASGVRHLLLRALIAVVFLLSFALNSTIVLYAFLMFGLFVAVWRARDPREGFVRRTWRAGWHCGFNYPDLILLPLVYWTVLSVWFRRSGVYEQHYNAHFPAFSELVRGWRQFLAAGYTDHVVIAMQLARGAPMLFVIAAAAVGIAVLLLRHEVEPARSRTIGAMVLPAVLATMLFLSLSLPYLISGLTPVSAHFYESRHLLMFGLPSAFVVLAFKRCVERFTGATSALAGVFGIATSLSIATLWGVYADLQARTLKQEALVQKLASRSQPAATVYGLDDGFIDYPSRHVMFGKAEVTGMLRLVWGDQDFAGFTIRAERPTILREMEVDRLAPGGAFHHVDPRGAQATISMQPGPAAAPNVALARRYYACRISRCDVSQLLDQLASVSIKVGPIAGVLPLEDGKPSQ